jgi:hypothetical protein
MTGGKGGQPQRAKLQRLSVRKLLGPAMRAAPMLVEPSGSRRAERQLVRGDVVGVRMRHEGPRLAPLHVNRQTGRSEKQTSIPMKHSVPLRDLL